MKSLFFLFISFLLYACDGQVQKQKNQEAFEQERRDRKLKVLSEAEILAGSETIGSEIIKSAQGALISKLTGAIKTHGIIGALTFCNIEALPILDSLSKKYQGNIQRVTFKPRNPQNYPDSLQANILTAYEYAISQGEKPGTNVQAIDNSTYLITSPIVINNSLCLQCHGVVGKDLSQEVSLKIQELYPRDKAKDYQLGNLRGMWSIKLSKKTIVNNL